MSGLDRGHVFSAGYLRGNRRVGVARGRRSKLGAPRPSVGSVGSVGDSYDNALAETVIGLFKTEVTWGRGPWRAFEDVEFAVLEWVDWLNNRRLLGPLGYVPPVEFETEYYRTPQTPVAAAGLM